jgi:hypothetical protein
VPGVPVPHGSLLYPPRNQQILEALKVGEDRYIKLRIKLYLPCTDL